MRVEFKLNGQEVNIEVNANTRLLEVLRTTFSCASVKCSCLQGFCGACTVLLNDEAVPSCMVPIFNVHQCEVETLEYFAKAHDKEYKKIMDSFRKANVKMCGFCDSGKIFNAYRMLKKKDVLDTKKIKELFDGQVCRCSVADSLIHAVSQI